MNRKQLRSGLCTIALAVAAVLGGAGCGGDDEGECNGGEVGGGSLEGSYCSTVDLRWTEVRTELQIAGSGTFFRVEYIRPAGDSFEKTLEVQFDTALANAMTGQDIPFLNFRGSVRRVTNVIQNLSPELDADRSTLTFRRFDGQIGSRVEGDFVLFFNSGRLLRGTFSGTLIDPTPETGG